MSPGAGFPGGGFQVDGRAMALEQMHSYLLDKLRQNPEKPVILRTDPGATYGNMIAVFDDLRMLEEDQNKGKSETDAKFKINISIPTRREIENIWSMLGVS